MVTNCCMCTAEESPIYPRRSFHKIPANEEMRQKWFQVIGRNVYKGARVCSDHFRESDYHEMNEYKKNRILKKTAVPFTLVQEPSTLVKGEPSTLVKEEPSTLVIEESFTLVKEEPSTLVIEESFTLVKEEPSTLIKEESFTLIKEESENMAKDSTILNIDTDMHTNTVENNGNVEIERSSNRERKSPQNNFRNSKVQRIFLNISEHSMECFRKTDFVSDQKWEQFLRCVSYSRHQAKMTWQEKKRLQNKNNVLTSKYLLQRNKQLITNNKK
ncbi:hypothetical protein DMN91_001687 [Ooceraea biroi]|uniref:THAP-type domain-containing protein n=2 Tax=Ooceraea biroi TaxID=2015173 RepID=A0A3L8DYK2_OOCBI|nr:uncharacterized protein LOC105276347 isoform X1 [Ooceraea biroi]RLU25531.1 hypothetical protein DMN91_001687 [Ooceraea biroi]